MIEVLHGANTLYAGLGPADPLKVAIGDRMVHGIADDDTPYPYVTMRQLSGQPGPAVSTEQKTTRAIQTIRFSVFAISDMEAGAIAELVEKTFRRGFPLPNGSVMAVFVRGEDLFEDPDRTSDQQEIWQAIKDIEYTIKRDFTTPVLT